MGANFQSSQFSNVRLGDVPGLAFGKFFRLPIAYIEYACLSFATLSNFWEVPLFIAKIRKKSTFKFRDGTSLELERSAIKAPPRPLLLLKAGGHKAEYNSDFTFASFDYAGKKVSLSGPKESPLFFAYSLFLGKKEYPKIDVLGKTVVDVGANIGDTAIYFALNGAEKVISFEPFSDLVKKAEENVQANSLGEKVELVTAGIGCETKTIPVAAKGEAHHAASQIPEGEHASLSPKTGHGKGALDGGGAGSIRIISLSDVVEKYALNDAVLKLDCEGAEYDILLKSENRLLRKFSTIVLEYHYGYVNIEKKLRSAGFRVRRCSGPKYDFNPAWENPHIRLGILLAERID